jgi:hypothetical protein
MVAMDQEMSMLLALTIDFIKAATFLWKSQTQILSKQKMSFKLVTAFVLTLGVMEAHTAVNARRRRVHKDLKPIGMLLFSTNE